MPLRPYQSELVEQTRQAWREGYHAPCIVLGCGGGKSVIVAEIARRTTFNGKKVLFLVHRQELVQQIIRTFIRWGVDMNYCDVMMVQTATRRIKNCQSLRLSSLTKITTALRCRTRKSMTLSPMCFVWG